MGGGCVLNQCSTTRGEREEERRRRPAGEEEADCGGLGWYRCSESGSLQVQLAESRRELFARARAWSQGCRQVAVDFAVGIEVRIVVHGCGSLFGAAGWLVAGDEVCWRGCRRGKERNGHARACASWIQEEEEKRESERRKRYGGMAVWCPIGELVGRRRTARRF